MKMNPSPTMIPPALPLLLLNDYPMEPLDPEECSLVQTLFRLLLRHGAGELNCPADSGGRLLSTCLGGACALSWQRPDDSGGLAAIIWEPQRGAAAWADFLEAHRVLHQGKIALPLPRALPVLAISLAPRLLARASPAEIQSGLVELVAGAVALMEYHRGQPRWN